MNPYYMAKKYTEVLNFYKEHKDWETHKENVVPCLSTFKSIVRELRQVKETKKIKNLINEFGKLIFDLEKNYLNW